MTELERSSSWLSPREVAPLLGISPVTVKRLEPAELPYFRVGSRGDRRYRPEDVELYIERRMVR